MLSIPANPEILVSGVIVSGGATSGYAFVATGPNAGEWRALVMTDVTDITAAGRALLDDASASAQRTTLGLGSAAIADSGDFAAASHMHVPSDVVGLGTAATRNVTASGEINVASVFSMNPPFAGNFVGWSNNGVADSGYSAASFAAAGHTHTEAEITDLGNYLTLADIASGTITPRADDIDFSGGSDGDVLTVQADGSLALEAAGGGISNVVEDTTPQLGGQLDVNGNAIGDGTRELLTFTEDASAVNHIDIENEATGSGPVLSSAGDDANIDLNLVAKGAGVVNADGSRVLTTADEGPSNGLDADTLDGSHAAAFAASSHGHSAGDITSGTFADGRIAASNVTQHQAALTITESQISDIGTTIAMVADSLSVFASTTSAQLAGVISDETGSGALVFGTQPTLDSPTFQNFLTGVERSSDPANPSEGNFVIWMSDGTGSGDDGDIMMKITAGGSTHTITLVDFSAAA